MTDPRNKNDSEQISSDPLYALVAAASLAPLAPAGSVRARVTNSLARPGRYGRFVDRAARLFELPIERVQQLLAQLEDGRVFVPFLADGIAMFPVEPGPTLAGSVAAFGRLTPGARFPHHDHVGDEVTLVLDGAFRDDDGREVGRGEELWKPAGSGHDFVVIGDRMCIAAVVARGGVAFR